MCQSILKQGDGVLVISSGVSRLSLVRSKSSPFCSEGMFETRFLFWFDG